MQHPELAQRLEAALKETKEPPYPEPVPKTRHKLRSFNPLWSQEQKKQPKKKPNPPELKSRFQTEELLRLVLVSEGPFRHGVEFEWSGTEIWVVLNEEERELVWEACLDIEVEQALDQLEKEDPEFDEEAFKKTLRVTQTLGNHLATDGYEREVKIDGQWFFVYRRG